jgi:hypothetical protein
MYLLIDRAVEFVQVPSRLADRTLCERTRFSGFESFVVPSLASIKGVPEEERNGDEHVWQDQSQRSCRLQSYACSRESTALGPVLKN